MVFKSILSFILATLCWFLTIAQQPSSYDKAWKKIDSLILDKGLTASAMTEVNKLYARAKNENNTAQLIKALLYRMGLQGLKEEDAAIKNINNIEKEISTAREPAKSILNSFAAEIYDNYLDNNRWKLYNRTSTVNFKKDDIATWGFEDLHKRITEHYLASIRNEKLLQQTRLESFNPIIIRGNVRYLRPTLYDLLTHRAIDYFRNDERDITKPAYAFEIDQPEAFTPAAEFIRINFSTRDTSSNQHKALLIYQKLIAFHLNDTKPDALLDVDIHRLQFIYDNSTVAEKESIYASALNAINSKYPNYPAASQALYLLAELHANKASRYQPLKDDSFRYEYVRSKEIVDRILAQKDSSEGKSNARILLNRILEKQLNIQTEKVNVNGLPFRSLVRYRNISQLYARIIRIDKRTRDGLNNNYWEENYWKQYIEMKATKSFTQSLPSTNDHQQHTVEIKIDPLAFGEYVLLVSVDESFSLKENFLAVQFFHVSNIAFFNSKNDYFVVNRNSGQPLARADVQVWYNQYDYNRGRNIKTKGENIITDLNGFFRIRPFQSQRNPGMMLEITTKDDYLFLNETVANYTYEGAPPPNRDSRFTFLFTDRAIYRPGQTVYFKGIMVRKNPATRESSIISDLASTVYLYDVNGQKVDSIAVRTSEFGSYSGKFRLPENLLNGRFWIQDKVTNNTQEFNVEEYKRPKFFVQIEKPAGTYKLNDSIYVKGQAKAYAGNNIDGALVKYRVLRRTRIPFYYGYERRIWPPSRGEEMEIAHGTAITDANGLFLIPFKAIPDNSIPKSNQPVFYYEVSADITDINGETRSGNTSVSVSYQAIQLSMDIPDKLPADSLKGIRVRSTNLNDVFEKTNVNISVYKLKTPTRVFRERYWEQPDQFIFTREEYYRLFPQDVYKDEDDVTKWEREKKEVEFSDTTYAGGGYSKGNLKLSPGWYLIEAVTKDKYGEEVKTLKYLELTGATITNPNAFGELLSDKSVLEPGEKINYQIRTNLDSVWLIHQINRMNKDSSRNFLRFNRNSQSYNITTTESDRGGIVLDLVFVKYNRFYTSSQLVQIPFTNKDLTITYASYRDKTLPGSEEKWKLKISGYKTDKVMAELLTGMYDASLDQFTPQEWRKPDLFDEFGINRSPWVSVQNFIAVNSNEKSFYSSSTNTFEKVYDQLVVDNYWNAIGSIGFFNLFDTRPRHMKAPTMPLEKALQGAVSGVEISAQHDMNPDVRRNYRKGDTTGALDVDGDGVEQKMDKQTDASAVQVRKNFNETAFFFPDLRTDSTGAIEFSFTIPEALTEWKWMSLAHTKDLAFGYSEAKIVTQKELMVQPNAPRFLREGDRIDFSGKIVNMSDKELTGQVELQLIDPTNNQPVDGWFRNFFPNQFFTVAAGQSSPISFTIEIPFQYNKPVTYRIIANTGKVSDGEEASLPVLTNRMLVTESLPLNMRGNGSKQFKFEKLIKSGNSESLNHHALTVEYTSNPAWYAVQSLPYLMEYPYDCAEQVFNRYYANALASMIANSSPRIAAIFEKWKTLDTAALMSNLQKNQELKAVLLQETPWVLQAKSEEQQKKNIALLFDMVRMNREMESSLRKLQDMQSPNGGFVWFKGGPDDRYITQYIITGIGHLKKLNALPKNNGAITLMIQRAVVYLDRKIKEDYENFLKQKKASPAIADGLSDFQIQFLYMRSFFKEMPISGDNLTSHSYYRKQSQQNWVKQSKYMQGMIALSLYRTGDIKTSNEIIASLKQNALHSEEMGMYWKEFNSGGYYWYQAPIESHSLLIEVFAEAAKDGKSVDDLKTWLLKQKQTQHWRTTKATADACYALLLQGSNWLTAEPEVNIQLGSAVKFSSTQGAEAGTGYFKKVVDSKLINPEMGNITVSLSSSQDQPTTSWGSVYWQYFEDLDKITPSSTPLKLTKKLFVEKHSDRGLVIEPLKEGDALKVGDKVKVRIELRVDRTIEYVHMKDMRASSLEPINVISSYKYQGGLGYYETTKDASTNFFFGYLPRGTWVFEYPLFVTHTGTFSNGVTSIQCMYAPEFTSHSEGIKIRVE